MRKRQLFFAAFGVIALGLSRPAAHDIPNDVLVQMFVKPEPQRLVLLVRVPLAAMRDVEIPTRGPGFLDLPRADPAFQDAVRLWLADNISAYENGARLAALRLLAVRASLPSDPSFRSFEEAIGHIQGSRLPAAIDLYWNQALLDVLLEVPILSARSEFAIHPAFARLGVRVVTTIRFLPPGGPARALEYAGDPGLVLLDPRWYQAARLFVGMGFEHILSGADHLLFLMCLVIPFRRFRQLVLIVTAFTVAHSITLIASALGHAPDALWFPPLIETLIAASIVYMALENIVGATSLSRRWVMTFAFGLVHGFGFSFALRRTLQFAGSHLLASLVSFNVGVELGQLLVLVLLVPLLQALFRFVVAERMGTIVLSAFVAHTAWHWLVNRADQLRQYQWPAPDVTLRLMAVRWLMVATAAVAVVWLVRDVVRRSGKLQASPGKPPRGPMTGAGSISDRAR
jgi:hypothetical protein